jgi:flagellar hook-length control protein FliK
MNFNAFSLLTTPSPGPGFPVAGEGGASAFPLPSGTGQAAGDAVALFRELMETQKNLMPLVPLSDTELKADESKPIAVNNADSSAVSVVDAEAAVSVEGNAAPVAALFPQTPEPLPLLSGDPVMSEILRQAQKILAADTVFTPSTPVEHVALPTGPVVTQVAASDDTLHAEEATETTDLMGDTHEDVLADAVSEADQAVVAQANPTNPVETLPPIESLTPQALVEPTRPLITRREDFSGDAAKIAAPETTESVAAAGGKPMRADGFAEAGSVQVSRRESREEEVRDEDVSFEDLLAEAQAEEQPVEMPSRALDHQPSSGDDREGGGTGMTKAELQAQQAVRDRSHEQALLEPANDDAQAVGQARTGDTHVNRAAFHPEVKYHPQGVSDQIKVHIVNAYQTGAEKITVQLHPADLGKVQVQLVTPQEGGSTQLYVLASSADALDALQRDSKELLRALQDAGIRAESGGMHFDLRDQSQNPHERHAFMQEQQPARQASVEPEVAPVAQAYAVGGGHSLDIRV